MPSPNEEFRRRYQQLKKNLEKPANNRRTTRSGNKPSLKAPKNNIQPTSGQYGAKKNPAILPTKRNRKILADAFKELKKVPNKQRTANRRDYIAKTTKAGVDEFNNTKLRAKKGGPSYSTKELAQYNKGKKIKASAKPTLKGGIAAAGLTAVELAAREGLLGKKVQQSFEASDRRKNEAYQTAQQKLQQLRQFFESKPKTPKAPNRSQRRKPN